MASIPDRTIKGTFPSIITPNTGFTGFRKVNNSSLEKMFTPRKKSTATVVLAILSRRAR